MTEQEYIGSGGTNCPVCGGWRLDGEDIEPQIPGTLTQLVWCRECESEWTDVYKLERMEGLRLQTPDVLPDDPGLWHGSAKGDG